MRRKWSPRSKLFAGLSVGFALASFFLVKAYVNRIQALEPGSPVEIVVAARDLERGTSLDPGMVKLLNVPGRFAPPGALKSPDDMAGRTLLSGVAEGEVLTDSRLSSEAGPVAGLVPAGLRAVTLPTSLPEGAVVEGDRVDVLATYTGGQPYTETTGESLEVLNVLPAQGGGISGGTTGPTLVLLVDPAGAERIAHALAFARMTISILGPDEEATQTPQPPTP